MTEAGNPGTAAQSQGAAYLGTPHQHYSVPVPVRRRIAQDWLRSMRDRPSQEILPVLESLFRGQSHEEKTLASLMLGCDRRLRSAVRPSEFGRWLDGLAGWAEVDSLCQNVFTADELLAAWPEWLDLITRLSTDGNVFKRRAALVLLTGPVHYSEDARFRDLAFSVIDCLAPERSIVITKAVSWLLRSMTSRHGEAVRRYLDENGAVLPRIALRETRTKLDTGRKSGAHDRSR